MKFMKRGHLGGYIISDAENPHGDPKTYTPKVWDYLVAYAKPERVLDVGCGEGHAVKYFLDLDPQSLGRQFPLSVLGLEGCQEAADRKVCRHHCMRVHDFTTGPYVGTAYRWTWGLVWSCEFVEHVEEKYAENFLKMFDRGVVVAMTHAFPGQGGYHHVNCQPTEYWVEKMELRGFKLDDEATKTSRRLEPDSHWARSGLIFRNLLFRQPTAINESFRVEESSE